MFNKFYIQFNYKNIVPFNLKKKKLRVHSNLIANKAVAAEGFIFGVKVKFWYYYYSINGLKKDNVLLIKNSLNKRLSVFFISNFNMIEGKWAMPKIYEQYYHKYWFLRKKKINIIRLFLNLNNNKNYILNIDFKSNLNNLVYKLYYLYNYTNIKILKVNYINNYYDLYKKINYIPLMYNKNISKNIKYLNNNFLNWKNKKYRLNSTFFNIRFNNLKNKIQNKRITWSLKKKNLINFLIKKNLLKIRQFIKLYKIINENLKKNILMLLYRLYMFYKFIKIYNNNNNIYKLNKINFLKLIFKKRNLKYMYNINYIRKFKKNLKKNYIFKIFYKNLLKKKNTYIYINFLKKILKKFKVLKKKKFKIFYRKFYVIGKSNYLYLIKNNYLYGLRNRQRKIKRKNKIKQIDQRLKSLYFKRKNIYIHRILLKKKLINLLKKKYKENKSPYLVNYKKRYIHNFNKKSIYKN